MSWQPAKIGDFLQRIKLPSDIEDSKNYKRVTIRIKHNGVSLRDEEIGKKIGTKKQFILKAGQFIVSKIDARYGAFGIAPQEVDDAIITGNFWAYDVDKTKVNIEWFNQYTSSQYFYDLCERASSGITHRKYLDEKFFLSHEIYLPSVDEQLKIIRKVKAKQSQTTSVTTELSRQLELVRQLRQAFLREAMQGQLVPQDETDESAKVLLERIKAEKEKLVAEKKIKRDKPLPAIAEEEIPFEIPENWVWCRLNEVCSYIIDCPHSTPKYIDKDTGFYGIDTNCINEKGEVVRLRNLSEESYLERIKRLTPTEKDIVYAREGSIGLATFIPPNKHICLGQRVMLFRPSTKIQVDFLKLCVTEEQYKNRLLEKHRGMGAKHVNVKDIVLSLVPLPPLPEQTRIVAKLEKLMAYCGSLETSIRESASHAENLLQVALKEALAPPS